MILDSNLIRDDRFTHAGGVCISIRKGLSVELLTNLYDTFEELWLMLILKSWPVVGVLYRLHS